MKESLKNFIRELSSQDKKTLSQKALKVSEEAGELAKVVLPFDNASGTIHRFVDKNRILEEVADLYLTSISVAYELGFTDDEIEDMISYKSKKWANLQQAESKVKGKIPYEIHVTVESWDTDRFKEICASLGVKPIVLALQTKTDTIQDVMTSSVHMGSNKSAYEEMKRISSGLQTARYNVVREKIETVPWHPAAPSSKHNSIEMPKDCYFETHIGVLVSNNGNGVEALLRLAEFYGAHMSRNAFKQHEDGTFTQMVTYRKYEGTAEEFEAQASKLEEAIKQSFEIEKRITEFSIYDTKVSHDAAWLTNEKSKSVLSVEEV